MKKTRLEPTIDDIGSDITPAEVVEYLAANPDFFDGRDELLAELNIPHRRGASVSLVERQVSLLRERDRSVRAELDKLLEAARDNDATFAKCRTLVLSLLEAKNGKQLLDSLEKGLTREFGCDECRLYVYGDSRRQVNHWVCLQPQASLAEDVGGVVSTRKPVFGVLRESELAYFFGANADKIQSAGVFPIRRRKDVGLLVLGSNRSARFQSGMGTLFTDFITDVLARLLPAHTYL